MKVSDVMQKHVDFVDKNTKVLDVARIIFGRRINGLPVCDGKKVVGFISDTDILAKFHPTMQEFAEDPFSSSNFEGMEEKSQEILDLTAKDIMSKKPITVNADDPLLRADSTMRLRDVGRLPVVDDKGNLVGIISMSDIFKSLVGKKMPYLESEKYHDWIAQHFDFAMGGESRVCAEVKDLTELFKKNGIKKVLDIGCGTGGHAIELAKNGFEVLGLESSRLMFKVAKDKLSKLPKSVQGKLKFINGDYVKILRAIEKEYGAAIFMGTAFADMPYTYHGILEALALVLSKKNAFIILQLSNFEKALKFNNGLDRFKIRQSTLSPNWKHAYLWFFDAPQKKGDLLMLNAVIFDFDGKMWTVRGTNRVERAPFAQEEIERLLKTYGFPKVSFYGAKEGEHILKDKFNPKESDWLNVVAKR